MEVKKKTNNKLKTNTNLPKLSNDNLTEVLLCGDDRVFQIALRGRGEVLLSMGRMDGKFCWGDFFIAWWESEEE